MLKVIYEDNHLLVCEKPPNIPVQADSSGDTDMLTLAKAYIKEKYGKPGEVYLGLVHRLDRPVGGVLVFARTSKAAARLTESFKGRSVEKKYAAIALGKPRDYAWLEDWLIRDEVTHSSFIEHSKADGAKRATLEYTRIISKKDLNLLEISLHSGRHHQIRVQLANAGCPIFGDQRYNVTAKAGQQIALHAYALTLEHPTLKTKMTFTSLPTGGAWSGFSDELSALTCGVRCSYVDKNIVCVNKQQGIACAIADDGENALEASLYCALGEIYPVHRLDVMTTGLVLFARNPRARDELQAAIRDRRIKKTYHAEVFGCPSKRVDRITLYAVKDAEKSSVTVFDECVKGAAEMITDYRVLKSSGGRSLLEIDLVTGRTHQIRASLAHIGCPVIGDDKYGDRKQNRSVDGGLHLAAVRIEFPNDMNFLHDLNGKTLERTAAFETGAGLTRGKDV